MDIGDIKGEYGVMGPIYLCINLSQLIKLQ